MYPSVYLKYPLRPRFPGGCMCTKQIELKAAQCWHPALRPILIHVVMGRFIAWQDKVRMSTVDDWVLTVGWRSFDLQAQNTVRFYTLQSWINLKVIRKYELSYYKNNHFCWTDLPMNQWLSLSFCLFLIRTSTTTFSNSSDYTGILWACWNSLRMQLVAQILVECSLDYTLCFIAFQPIDIYEWAQWCICNCTKPWAACLSECMTAAL